MQKIKLDYVYPWQHYRVDRHWEKRLALKNDLATVEVKNGYALPKISQQHYIGEACVTDENGAGVPLSYFLRMNKHTASKAYQFDKKSVEKMPGTWVYLGPLDRSYGHFILDFSARLYFMLANKGVKGFFTAPSYIQDFQQIRQTERFLELMGLGKDDYAIFTKPTQFENIIVPEQGFVMGEYYSDAHKSVFKKVAENIRPSMQSFPEKVFFSRSRFMKDRTRELGLELIDQLFQDAGYHIAYPEELSLDDQIGLIRNSREYVLTTGTIAHSVVFGQGLKNTAYLLNKYPYFHTPQTNLFQVADVTPVPLDFYIAKYPHETSYGPFVYGLNENMRRFIWDKKIPLSKSHVYTESYLAKTVQDSIKAYHARWPGTTYSREFQTSPESDSHFPLRAQIDWLDNYSKYELGGEKASLADSVKGAGDENKDFEFHNLYLPTPSHSSRLVNRLLARFPSRTYLEIGVAYGNTFLNVHANRKTAVDPSFRFHPHHYANSSIDFYSMTSDEFFRELEKKPVKPCYDVIFLDGLHSFRQTLIDFCNTMPYSHEKTLWILDDTVPCDPWSSIPDMSKTYKYRRASGSDSGAWHGDVYKCVFAIHDYLPEFSYCTVYDHGNPQTVVWRAPNSNERKPVFKDLDEIATINYFDFLDNCAYHNLVTENQLYNLIGSEVVIRNSNPDPYLATIVPKILK